jgi:hypothetical protein
MLLKERKFSIYRWKNNFVLSNTAFKEKRKSAMELVFAISYSTELFN